MKIDTLGGYNVTPEITHFSGKLERLNVDDVGDPERLTFKEPTVLLLEGDTRLIPADMKVLRPNVTGVIFLEGGSFFHPALCVSAEGVPCAVKPGKDLSPHIGKQVTVDISSGQILTDEDARAYKPKEKSPMDVTSYPTETEVSVFARSMQELRHLEGLAKKGVRPTHIVAALEPVFYKAFDDPYKLAKEGSPKLTAILKEYIVTAAEVAEKSVYVRTPEVSGVERGSSEEHISGLAELRGVPYDVQIDPSFLKYLFKVIEEVKRERPDIAKKIDVAVAMPRSSQDMTDAIRIMEESTSLRAGKDVNVTGFVETPYWLMPTAAQTPEMRQLTKEAVKEGTIKDQGRRIFWGTGDLNACTMASGREIPQMKGYMSHRADTLEALRKSVPEWNKLGFKVDINGGLVWRPFKTDEENMALYDMLLHGNVGLTVKTGVFEDVKRLVHQVEKRRNQQRGNLNTDGVDQMSQELQTPPQAGGHKSRKLT